MNLREWLDNNRTIAAVVVVIILVASLGVIYLQTRESQPQPGGDIYFMDLGTMDAFSASPSQAPPITAPSGEDGVIAHLYSCGECTPEQWFGYLETYVGEGRRLQQEGYHPADPQAMEILRETHMIRPLEDGQWVHIESDAGQRIRNEVNGRCEGNATFCRP